MKVFRNMRTSDKVWSAIIAAATAYELVTLRVDPDSTFSRFTRRRFRTDTRSGRVIFTGVTAGTSIWFIRHILKPSDRDGNVV